MAEGHPHPDLEASNAAIMDMREQAAKTYGLTDVKVDKWEAVLVDLFELANVDGVGRAGRS